MCGIIGFVGYAREGQWRQTHDLLRALFLASEHRGEDSTGLVFQTKPLDNPLGGRIVLAKEPITASQFILGNTAFHQLRHQRCSVFLGHVRAATHGSPANNANNHPHVGKDGLYLVHNGVCSNYREIQDKYALRLESECDSEVLLRLIEASGNPAVGLSNCLREVAGSMAVMLFDSATGLVWAARNHGRPLWLARLHHDRRMFFASTAEIIMGAFQKVMGRGSLRDIECLLPVPEDTPIAISPLGMMIAAIPE
jgi:glucosamine--fructose-6-phosphate aminotransferase (isomerizing)